MDLGLDGKTAVVTGADSGIGKETVRLLLAEGARVVMADRTAADIEATAEELRSAGEVHAAVVDVTRPDSVDALREFALDKLGHVDILVNTAGITGPTGDFHTVDDAGWHETLDINLMGAVRLVRAFLPHMLKRRSGRIILIGSEDAEQPYADELPYCVSKAGILNLAKGLAKAYGRKGIRVNAVSPAFIATPMTDAMMDKRAKENRTTFDEAVTSFLKEERPTLELQRRGRPEEVAATIVFLVSERAAFMTGANVRVDGGSVATV